MAGELAGDIKRAAKGRKIVLVADVTARHTLPNRIGEFLRNNPYQDLKQSVSLPIELGGYADVDLHIERNGQHVHESSANAGVLHLNPAFGSNVDLGKDFQRAPFRGNRVT